MRRRTTLAEYTTETNDYRFPLQKQWNTILSPHLAALCWPGPTCLLGWQESWELYTDFWTHKNNTIVSAIMSNHPSILRFWKGNRRFGIAAHSFRHKPKKKRTPVCVFEATTYTSKGHHAVEESCSYSIYPVDYDGYDCHQTIGCNSDEKEDASTGTKGSTR